MKTAFCPKTHEKLASSSVGAPYGHVPGHYYHDVDVVISRKGDRFRVHVVESRGSCQGYDQEHGRTEVTTRGSTIEEAVSAAKSDAIDAGINISYLTQALSLAEDEAEDALDA